MSTWVEEQGEILQVTPAAPGHVRLEVRAPRMAALARPGQFAMLRVTPGPVPYLRRPFSFFDLSPEEGRVSFLVRVLGTGTVALVARGAGQSIGLLGPLGNGFPWPGGGTSGAPRQLLLVAGGVGVAPFPPVVRAAVAAGARVTALVGARSAGLLLGIEELRRAGAEVKVSTEDGSLGRRGVVTDFLAEATGEKALVYACGPAPMLARVAEVVGEKDLYVSLEQRLGCGFGVCRGCAVPGRRGGYRHVCRDGPVFPAGEIDLATLARWGEEGGCEQG